MKTICTLYYPESTRNSFSCKMYSFICKNAPPWIESILFQSEIFSLSTLNMYTEGKALLDRFWRFKSLT